jgi:hypothetical protein
VDEEAEHQVVAGDRAEERTQALAGAQAAADRVDHLDAELVVAHERDPAVGQHAARLRLGDVVQERDEAQRLPGVELVADRLAQLRVDLCAEVLAEDRRRVGLDLDLALEHLDRVPVDVEVVVAALLDAVELGQLRQDRGEHARAVGEVDAGEHAGRCQQPPQLGEDALAGGLGRARRRGAGRVLGGGVRREAELGRQPDEAKRAQRVGLVGAGQDAQDARLDVGGPAERVDQLGARGLERDGHRVGGEVAVREILLDRRALERRGVRDPAVRRRAHRPPGAELLGEPERRSLAGLRDRLRRLLGRPLEREVDVDDRAAEQRVAHGAADDPGARARERPARHAHRLGVVERGEAHPCSRRTRAVSPHVTS